MMSVIVADGLSVRERKGCLVESLVDGQRTVVFRIRGGDVTVFLAVVANRGP